MKRSMQSLLFWMPRGLGLLFAGFLSLFALDVFGEGASVWETMAALLIHLIPTAILLGVLALSWRWPWVGALGFIGFAAWYLSMSWGQFPLSVYILLAGLPFAVGLLFLADWLGRGGLRDAATLGH